MNETPRFQPGAFSVLAGQIPGDDGVFFTYHFDADGYACADAASASWTWSSLHLGDVRARLSIGNDPQLPAPIKEAMLAPGHGYYLDHEADWLHGALPDLRHDYSGESRGLTHFRFALDPRRLIEARKQPLRAVDQVRRMVENRVRSFRSPAQLLEALVNQSFAGMVADFAAIAERLDGIEDKIVSDHWQNERHRLVEVRRQLVAAHRQTASLSSMFRHADTQMGHDVSEAFADLVARLQQKSAALHHDGEQLQGRARLMQDELMAKLTEQSNRLLYALSVMTAVLLPMTIISGLFGMNVGGLPFLENHEGFWIVTILSFLVAGATLLVVRRLGDRS